MPVPATVLKVVKALGLVAAGGALAALASWASSHSASDPTIAVVVALAVREIDHALGLKS